MKAVPSEASFQGHGLFRAYFLTTEAGGAGIGIHAGQISVQRDIVRQPCRLDCDIEMQETTGKAMGAPPAWLRLCPIVGQAKPVGSFELKGGRRSVPG